MCISGAHVAYSELFDRPPDWDEVLGAISGLDRLSAVLLLSRVNTHLRHAFQETKMRSVGWIRMLVARNLVDEGTWRLIQEHLPREQGTA